MFSKYIILVIATCFSSANSVENSLLERIKRSLGNDAPSLQLINFENKGYYIHSIFQANYFQAMQFCRYHGMRLLSITSKAENDFLEKNIRELSLNKNHFWTSGTILPNRNPWIWMSTGRPFSYIHWDVGEPTITAGDEKNPENCMEVRIIREGLWWNDLGCADKLNFICEVPITQTQSFEWSIQPRLKPDEE